MASFKVCVDGHPISCHNIISLSFSLISRLRKHDLLLSTVSSNV